ncbi:unnamed protein product [Lactuca saligna]|uniref:Uncharacterized protein n=1 Tax=Lactuca saligna TaxID=75948 RepID=A0AA35YVS9_LACSI|nr:unnamed protein product [Lactuca saligna]
MSHSLREILTKVKSNVADIKHIVASIDDGDEENPPSSPGNDQPPLPPPPSGSNPPPPPFGENQELVMMTVIPFQNEQCESEREDNQGAKSPLGTRSDIESDDDQVNPRKRKASFLGGSNDAKAGSSSAVGCSSVPPPSKKRKLTVYLEELDQN